MNIEVEIKVKLSKAVFNSVKEKMPKMGKLIKSIKQIDEYYVPYHRDFFARKPFPVEWLRIRTNPNSVVFEYDKSYHGENGEQDYVEEYETEILQPEEFKKTLEFLDFKKVIVVDKNREYWNCGDFEICLDVVKDLGFFIEVESKKDFGSNIVTKQECANFLNKLEIENWKENHMKTGYPVLVLEKLKTN